MLGLLLLTYLSYVVLFGFGTLCLACGLYYIAELVEEYTVLTRKVLRYSITTIVGIYFFVAIFDDLPFLNLAVGLLAHGVSFTLLKPFPFIELTDTKFLISCGLAVVNHWLWFIHFTNVYYPFSEVIAFFVICVWLIPFGFFVSLSANENTLPQNFGNSTLNGDTNMGMDRRQGKAVNRLLSLFNFLKRKKSVVLPEVLGTSSVKLG